MVESGEPRGGASELVRLEPAALASAGLTRVDARLRRTGSEAQLQRLVFALVILLGVLARYRYVFDLHAPRHHVTSDAGEVVALAQKLGSPHAQQTIADTIWPPGTAALLAPLLALDPSLEAAAWLHFLASTATFLLVGYAAFVAAGARAGAVATSFAAFHFGFIHYTGVFLSEQLFQFAVALALAVTAIALRAAESDGGSRWGLRLFGHGALIGLCWSLAATIRPNALPVALLTGAALLALALRRRGVRVQLLAGALLAFTLALVPLADRCSRLSGRFCAVSNNVAMNVALGQAGEVKGLEFRDAARPELTTSWVPPALLHHGYETMGSVTRAIYDAPGVLAWVLERWRQDPGMFVVRAAGNALDLFRLEYWPDEFGGLPKRAATVAKQAFLLLVVAPGLVAFVGCALRRLRSPESSVVPVALTAVFGSVVLSAALSMGEPRYRIPFDGVLIVLAATMYTRSEPALFARTPVAKHTKLVLYAASAVAGALLLVVTCVSHPALRAVARSGLATASAAATHREVRPAADFDRAVALGSAWDAPSNYVFPCRARCGELALTFRETQRIRALEVVLDHNDSYALRFLEQGRELGAVLITRRFSRGVRSETVSIPPSARAGFDQVVLFPLYGDGRYSVAAVRPRP